MHCTRLHARSSDGVDRLYRRSERRLGPVAATGRTLGNGHLVIASRMPALFLPWTLLSLFELQVAGGQASSSTQD
jgi:hypothetical protein